MWVSITIAVIGFKILTTEFGWRNLGAHTSWVSLCCRPMFNGTFRYISYKTYPSHFVKTLLNASSITIQEWLWCSTNLRLEQRVVGKRESWNGMVWCGMVWRGILWCIIWWADYLIKSPNLQQKLVVLRHQIFEDCLNSSLDSVFAIETAYILRLCTCENIFPLVLTKVLFTHLDSSFEQNFQNKHKNLLHNANLREDRTFHRSRNHIDILEMKHWNV